MLKPSYHHNQVNIYLYILLGLFRFDFILYLTHSFEGILYIFCSYLKGFYRIVFLTSVFLFLFVLFPFITGEKNDGQ